MSEYCKAAATFDTLEVVAQNFNTWFVGVDFSINYSDALLWYEDIVPADLWIGSSEYGIAIVWQIPQNGFNPIVVLRTSVLWTGTCHCGAPPQVVTVGGYIGLPHPMAVRWPDYQEFDVLGATSSICAEPVSVHSTTWGSIKALYR